MLKIVKFTDVCMTGGIMHTPSHTNVCKFYNFQHGEGSIKIVLWDLVPI